MSEPTPGPWCLSPNGTHVRRTLHGYNIASVSEALDPDEIAANARLIAAAPDLLAAAQDAQCECGPRERASGHRVGCWMPALSAAIAKATGVA